jgi:hypothetical protein
MLNASFSAFDPKRTSILACLGRRPSQCDWRRDEGAGLGLLTPNMCPAHTALRRWATFLHSLRKHSELLLV